MEIPKGTFHKTAVNLFLGDGKFYAKLKRINGEYNRDYVVYDPKNELDQETSFENIDGFFGASRSIIPSKIFQTHKSMEYIQNDEQLKMATDSWKKEGFEYHFFTDDECEKFIKENFDENVYKAYMKCPRVVMKADLWRYCVIYFYGGIYADADTICLTHPSIFLRNSQLVLVPESDNIHLCQWVFSAPQHSPVLKSIIDLSVERILNRKVIKGHNIIHKLTGPGVFTSGIEKFLKENNYTRYVRKRDYTDYPETILYVFEQKYFHKCVIQHLYTGCRPDGWKNNMP